jgi:hypothetical protein
MRTWQRVVLAGAVGAGAVAAAVASVRSELPRAEAALPPSFDPFFPPFDRAPIYPMGEDLKVEGVPMRLGYFTARATPKEVTAYYSALWRRQNLTVTGQDGATSAHASGFDGVTGVVHSVSVMAQGERVIAFCSVTSIQADPRPAAREEPIPVPEGARFVERTATGGSEGGQASVTYLADGTRASHEAELKRVLGAQGWQVVEGRTHASATGETLEFKRGRQALLAALFDDPHSATVGVQLHATRAEDENAP